MINCHYPWKENFCPLLFITVNVLTLNLTCRLSDLYSNILYQVAFSLPILFSEKSGKQICYSYLLIKVVVFMGVVNKDSENLCLNRKKNSICISVTQKYKTTTLLLLYWLTVIIPHSECYKLSKTSNQETMYMLNLLSVNAHFT